MKKTSPPDPRCAFASAAYLSLYAIFVQRLWLVSTLLFLAFVTAVLWGVSFRDVFGKLKRLWQIIIIVALLNSLFSPSGEIWIQIGSVALLTSGGVIRGFVVLFRLSILILGGSLFTKYGVRELIQGMVRLKLPYEIAYMISIGIRFIPLMSGELRDSLTALALRGVIMEELTLRQRIKVYTYLMMPMVAGSLHNARALSMSMEMRGFGAYPDRTGYFELTMVRRDYYVLAITGILVLLTGASCFLL